MDLQALEYTREHYNRHAGQYADTQQALHARATGPGAPLKKFHNTIKRQLIQRFATGIPRLLDLCCGRGGDIWKWIDAGIQYVKGIDLSEGEVEEARHRLSEAKKSRNNISLECDFIATPDLGLKEWQEEAQYDAVTCMFAIHYFFVSEQALKQFLHNVSINLKDGGYFIGTVPDGKRVNQCIRHGKVYDKPMLRIEAHWQGEPQCFGSPYICAIGDTVTSGDAAGSMGSFEYLVYFNVLEGVAAKFGLRLVTDYGDRSINNLFERADLNKGFKHFAPSFPHDSDPSLTEASALNVAFVFQKTSGMPVAPPLANGQAGQQPQRRQQQQQEQQQQQQGRKREREPPVQQQQQAEQPGKRAHVDGDGGSAPGSLAGAGAAVQQQGQPGASGPKETYKRPTARRRADGQGPVQ